jgi:hypothetical protein
MSKKVVGAVLAAAMAACRPSPPQEAPMTPAVRPVNPPAAPSAWTLRAATFALG